MLDLKAVHNSLHEGGRGRERERGGEREREERGTRGRVRRWRRYYFAVIG
jgi:hypothetical protein